MYVCTCVNGVDGDGVGGDGGSGESGKKFR